MHVYCAHPDGPNESQEDITKMEQGVFQLPDYAGASDSDEQAVCTTACCAYAPANC